MTATLLGLLLLSGLAAQSDDGPRGDGAVEAVGRVALELPDSTADLAPAVAAEGRWLAARGCTLAVASREERAAVSLAAARLRAMLADPAFTALVRDERDWAVPAPGGAWRDDPDAGARALAALLDPTVPGPAALALLSYGAAPGATCASLAGDATNAYSVPERGVVLLRRAYLADAVTGDPDAPTRLAGTLVHEVLHALGFAHPDLADVGAVATYRRTVPVWFACAARHWPDVNAVHNRCGAASGALARLH
ncbi:MAG: hypothetical protein H6745_31920 [Deltaproteobacteria bacterium]|nr:hypothetical protein [Deltaproteobacteria bacterium]